MKIQERGGGCGPLGPSPKSAYGNVFEAAVVRWLFEKFEIYKLSSLSTVLGSWGGIRGEERGTPYHSLYEGALPKKGLFFRF